MNSIKLALMGLALGSAATFAGDCTPPELPSLADGSTASMDDMLAGQKAVKTFQTANLEYMGCLDPQIAAAADAANADSASNADKAAVKQLEELYNAAVSKEEELAGQFNTEIREYKAANPS
jgi:hypothetical protein